MSLPTRSRSRSRGGPGAKGGASPTAAPAPAPASASRRARRHPAEEHRTSHGPPAVVSVRAVLEGMPASEHWRADNEHITHGYRVRHGCGAALRSLCTLHNDAGNVWTHLLGAVAFLAALAALAVRGPGALPFVPLSGDAALAAHEHARGAGGGGGGGGGGGSPPVWPLALFCAVAALCMGVSAAYHLLHVVSERTYSLLARLDYACIAVLTWGSFVALVTYAFACAPPAVWAGYTALATLSNGACVAVSLVERFRTKEYRLFRMTLFIVSGAVGVLPFSHILATPDARQPTAEACVLLMGALYIGGALLYGFRVPERFAPGRFDLFMASHTIFHIAVFLACCAHLNALLAFYVYRATTDCPAAAAGTEVLLPFGLAWWR